MRFTINLATRTLLDHRLFNRVLALALALLAVIFLWNIFRFSWNLGEIRRYDADMAAAAKRLKILPPAVSESEQAAIQAETTFFNGIIGRKSFGWLDFLGQLEEATPEGIALTLLSPDMSTGNVRIEGWARGFRDLQAFMTGLEDSGSFRDVLLLSHKNVELWEEAKGMSFSLSCRVIGQ